MDYRTQAEQAKQRAELELEEAGLLERLAEVQATKKALSDGTPVAVAPAKVAAPKAATTDAPKRRGRPPKQKAEAATAAPVDGQPAPKRRGRPPKNPNAVVAPKEKRIELPALLETIIQSHGKPMKHEELVVAARNAGYKTAAKDFSNMVYQCLVKLVKKGTLNKANEGKNAEYTFRAA
jgi:hypothetical protein